MLEFLKIYFIIGVIVVLIDDVIIYIGLKANGKKLIMSDKFSEKVSEAIAYVIYIPIWPYDVYLVIKNVIETIEEMKKLKETKSLP